MRGRAPASRGTSSRLKGCASARHKPALALPASRSACRHDFLRLAPCVLEIPLGLLTDGIEIGFVHFRDGVAELPNGVTHTVTPGYLHLKSEACFLAVSSLEMALISCAQLLLLFGWPHLMPNVELNGGFARTRSAAKCLADLSARMMGWTPPAFERHHSAKLVVQSFGVSASSCPFTT
jgi:hypothetical protein